MAPAQQRITGCGKKMLRLQRMESKLPNGPLLCADLSDRKAVLAKVPHVQEAGGPAGGHEVRLAGVPPEAMQRKGIPGPAVGKRIQENSIQPCHTMIRGLLIVRGSLIRCVS